MRPITFPTQLAAVKHQPKKSKSPAEVIPFRPRVSPTPPQPAADMTKLLGEQLGKMSSQKRDKLLAALILEHCDSEAVREALS